MEIENTEPEIRECSIDEIARALSTYEPRTEPSPRTVKKAAVAMILRENGDAAVETLFIQRAEHPGDPWSGQMAFPGGRMDPTDPTLESAARRETREEVGIELEPEMQIGRLSDIEGGRLTLQHLSVAPFVFHYPAPTEFVLNHEVADAVWVPLAFLAETANVRPYKFPLDPLKRDFPAFHFAERYTIWGVTYRIVAEFLSLLGRDLPGEPQVTNVE